MDPSPFNAHHLTGSHAGAAGQNEGRCHSLSFGYWWRTFLPSGYKFDRLDLFIRSNALSVLILLWPLDAVARVLCDQLALDCP